MTRARRIARAIWMAALTVLAASSPAAGQTRDFTPQVKSEPGGTGLITGTIRTDEPQPRPVRRAVVTITEAASIIHPRVVTSDEQGRFFFRNLPAGRYSVSARRAPYLMGTYGARRIAGPGSVQTGTTIVLGTGQQIASVDVTMLRGAVITGTVRDTDGQPARGVRVGVMFLQRSATTGERTLVGYSGSAGSTTDDRGVYRLYGLPPGAYVVVANPATPVGSGDAIVVTDADIARATALLQQIGMPAAAPVTGGAPPAAAPPRRSTVAYAPIYYPGTPDSTQASTVTVEVGEERANVDLPVQLISTARIEGTVVGPNGPVKERIAIRAIRTGGGLPGQTTAANTTPDPQGRFVLSSLAPGTYTIDARTMNPEQGVALYARSEVSIFGTDRTESLTLQPAMSVSGRIVFDGATAKPVDVTKARVTLTSAVTAVQAGPEFTAVPQGPLTPSSTGEFSVPGVVPGRYRLGITLPIPSVESGWWLKSATINGQDSLDGPVEIRPGETITDATMTMTDRPTEIGGTITDGENRAAPEYFIILFPADQAHWIVGSRRIQQTRPSSDGSFSFKNVPAGAYRLAAVTDVQQGEWFDPVFLTELLAASVPVTLGESGRLRQDLRIR